MGDRSRNFVLATMIECLGESFALMEKSGVDPKQFLEVLNGGAFQSPVLQNYGTRIIERGYDPAGFSLALGFKDTRLAEETAVAAQVPMPLTGVLLDRFLEALAKGFGQLDWSAIAGVAREDAGVKKTLRAGG